MQKCGTQGQYMTSSLLSARFTTRKSGPRPIYLHACRRPPINTNAASVLPPVVARPIMFSWPISQWNELFSFLASFLVVSRSYLWNYLIRLEWCFSQVDKLPLQRIWYLHTYIFPDCGFKCHKLSCCEFIEFVSRTQFCCHTLQLRYG